MKEKFDQNLGVIAKREQIKQNAEDMAWKSVNDAINGCIEFGKIAEAEQMAREAIYN
jgi:hypothetical protein